MKPGRNDPCPCGSGKKYKHCHLLSDEAPRPEDMTWRRLRRINDGLATRLLSAAKEHFGLHAIDEAWAEFNLWEAEEGFDPESAQVPVFIPWFLYDWLPDPQDTEVALAAQTTTAAQAYLQAAGSRLDPLARRYVEACGASPFSFHEVVACTPGQGFRLRDVLLGTEIDVIERQGSADAQSGDLIFAKVVAIEDVAVLDGCSPVLIPPAYKPEILELRARLPAQRPLFGADILREYDLEIREVYLGIADALLHPQMPSLANTDGDPLEFQELVFDIDSPRAAFDALKGLDSGSSEDEILQGAEFDRSGELVSAEIVWRRQGNAMHTTWDNTVLGTLKIKPGRLTAEVSSARRAEELRALIERSLGDKARYRTKAVQSVESMLAQEPTAQEEAAARRREAESARLAELPEVKAAMTDMLRTHYRNWVDEKIPALGNRTPREAMRDAEGREAVEALVRQVERDGVHMQPPLDRAIVRELRETLGLAGE